MYYNVDTMDIQRIKRRPKEDRKTIMLSIRISPKIQKWLIENDYSPTGIFYEAIQNQDERQNCVCDPFNSAIACILARSTRRPVIIENIDIESNGKTVKTYFRLLEQ